MSTNARDRDATIRSWMRLVRLGRSNENVLLFAESYGRCCAIGDSVDISEVMGRLQAFIDDPTPQPDDDMEREEWIKWWAEILDGADMCDECGCDVRRYGALHEPGCSNIPL